MHRELSSARAPMKELIQIFKTLVNYTNLILATVYCLSYGYS